MIGYGYGPGAGLTTNNRFARMLMRQQDAAPPVTQHTQGLAQVLRGGLSGWMMGKDRDDRAAAMEAMTSGMSAQPWINPDTGNAESPYYEDTGSQTLAPVMVPSQAAGGIPGAIAATQKLGGNEYAQRNLQGLLMQQGAAQAETARVAEQRAYTEELAKAERARVAAALTETRAYKESQKPRATVKGADGYNYYTDTGERVLSDVEAPPTETFTTVPNPYGMGGAGQVSSLTGQISGYQAAPDANAGGYEGTGMAQQDFNTLTQSPDPTSQIYAGAYARMAAPKVRYNAMTQTYTTYTPDMSMYASPTFVLGGEPLAAPPVSAETVVPSAAPPDQVDVPPAPPSTVGQPIVTESGVSEPMWVESVSENGLKIQTHRITGEVKAMPGSREMSGNQADAALYADRMRASDQIIGAAGDEATSLTQSALSGIPVLGNILISEQRQLLDQAKRDFINATLRRESGAAIAPTEFESADQQYFPQPGDTAATIAQKARNRKVAIEGISRAAGPLYKPKDDAGATNQPVPPQSLDDLLDTYAPEGS